MTTGQKIKKLRQSRNLSQKELGIMSGLSEPAIRNYELGIKHQNISLSFFRFPPE